MVAFLNPSRAEYDQQRSNRMRRTRRNHAPVFKANIVLAAIWGSKILAEWLNNSTFTLSRFRSGSNSCRSRLPTYSAVGRELGQQSLISRFLAGSQ